MLFCHLPFYIHCLFYFSTLFVILLLHTLFLPVTIIYGYCHNGRRLVLLLCGGLQSVFTLSFRKNQCKIRTVILRIHRHPSGKLMERRTEPMSILDFIAIVSFGLTCFSIGYTFGKDNHKTQK